MMEEMIIRFTVTAKHDTCPRTELFEVYLIVREHSCLNWLSTRDNAKAFSLDGTLPDQVKEGRGGWGRSRGETVRLFGQDRDVKLPLGSRIHTHLS